MNNSTVVTVSFMRLFHLFASKRAAVAIEFAIILPLLLLMTLPVYDYFRYILMLQKINKTASTVADMIIMSQPAPAGTSNGDPAIAGNPFILTEDRLANIMGTADFLMQPFNFVTGGGGYVNAVSIYKPAGKPTPEIYWSYSYRDTWKALDTSVVPGTPFGAGQPFFDQMAEGENTIVVAACMNYAPVFNFNRVILPFVGVSIATPTPAEKKLAPGALCTPDMVTATRYYPARNGPLTKIYTP
jgi:hypothetical protein